MSRRRRNSTPRRRKRASFTSKGVVSKKPKSRKIDRWMDLIKRLQRVPTATVSDALDRLGFQGVMDGISPLTQGTTLCGPALTVKEEVGELGTYSLDEFRIGEVINVAKRNDVIVFDAGGRRVSTWGGLATRAAMAKGLGGVVADGAVRDIEEIRELRFPVFARHVAPTSGKTRISVSSINDVIQCGGVRVTPGDIVVGDDTGLVVVPRNKAPEVLKTATELLEAERRFEKLVEQGRTFGDAARELLHM